MTQSHTRRCNSCKERQTLDRFPVRPNGKIHQSCKRCHAAWAKKRYHKDKSVRIVRSAKTNDRLRGMRQGDITPEWHRLHVTRGSCCYCGRTAAELPPKQVMTIERLDNTLPHDKSNCAAACSVCNFTRSNRFTHEEFAMLGPWLRQIFDARASPANSAITTNAVNVAKSALPTSFVCSMQ